MWALLPTRLLPQVILFIIFLPGGYRRLEREYREDMEAHEQRSGAAAAIIHATLTPIAKSYVKGMTEPLTMWNTLRERLSPRDNVGRQQSLCMEFDLLTFNNKEDINIYFEKL